jgi:hypothetical protein
MPFGSLAGGLAVSAFGLRPALLAAATLYGVTTLAPFAFPVWRQMDCSRPHPHPRPGRAAEAAPGSRPAADVPTLS